MKYPRTFKYMTESGYDFRSIIDPKSRYETLLKILGHENIEVSMKSAKQRLLMFEKSGTISLAPYVYKPSVPKKPKKKGWKKLKSGAKGDAFYLSWEWKAARFEALKKYKPVCMLCGATSKETRICVDHIIPISKGGSPLDLNNLQILCNDCNRGKSNKHYDDFRDPAIEAFKDKMSDERA